MSRATQKELAFTWAQPGKPGRVSRKTAILASPGLHPNLLNNCTFLHHLIRIKICKVQLFNKALPRAATSACIRAYILVRIPYGF